VLFCVVLRLDVVRTNLGLLLHADEFGQTVVHLLDGLVFSQAHAALVRDVVDATLGLGVLASGSAHLQVELAGDLLELLAVGGQLGQLDVGRGADGGAQVGRAEGQEAETVVVRERQTLLDLVDGVDQTRVDGLQVATLLHRDDAQVVLLVAPHQEGLVHVVVDAAAARPVAASVGSLRCNKSIASNQFLFSPSVALPFDATQKSAYKLSLTWQSRNVSSVTIKIDNYYA